MLLASIGVLLSPLITQQNPMNRHPARRRLHAKPMALQDMRPLNPTTLPLPRLPMELHIQHTRLHLPLPHQGPSPRIHTRPTSSPLVGKATRSRRILLTLPRPRQISTAVLLHPPLARMPPQVQPLPQATTLRPTVANILCHNNLSRRETRNPVRQNDISLGWCYLISCAFVEFATAWHCSPFPRHSDTRRYPSSGSRSLCLESGQLLL